MEKDRCRCREGMHDGETLYRLGIHSQKTTQGSDIQAKI